MTEYTPYLRLVVPVFEEVPWDQINDNWRKLDNTVGAFVSIPDTASVWLNQTLYTINKVVIDPDLGSIWLCQIEHTSSPTPTTFAQYRAAFPTVWTQVGVISGSAFYLPLTGGTLTDELNITTTAVDNGPNGSNLNLSSGMGTDNRIDGRRSGVSRWTMVFGDDIHETGANSGSNFAFYSHADGGASLGPVFTVSRATRVIDFKKAPTINGVALAETGVPINVVTSNPNGGPNGSYLSLDSAVGTHNSVFGKRSGKLRWDMIFGNESVEGGADTGTDFVLRAFKDDGITSIGDAISILRKTLAVFLRNVLTIKTTAASSFGQGSSIIMDGDVGTPNSIDSKKGSLDRWYMALGDPTPEAAGDIGSDFVLNAYHNSGAYFNTPLKIKRSTGIVDFAFRPTVVGVPVATSVDVSDLLTEINDLKARVTALGG